MRSRRLILRTALALALPVCALPSPASAQSLDPTPGDRVQNVLVNAAIGATLGGVRALIRRDRVAPAVVRGAFGGGVLSAGKQIAGNGVHGAGAFGRVVTAAGIAIVARGDDDTLRIRLPVGPLLFELRPGAEDRLQTRVNAWTTVTMLALLADADSRFDARASLSIGAPVFSRSTTKMPFASHSAGFAYPGIVILNRDAVLFGVDKAEILAHEAIHILQWDALHALVGRPVESAALRRMPGGKWLDRRVELGVVAPLVVVGASVLIPNELDRPWEKEAYALTRAPRDLYEKGWLFLQ